MECWWQCFLHFGSQPRILFPLRVSSSSLGKYTIPNKIRTHTIVSRDVSVIPSWQTLPPTNDPSFRPPTPVSFLQLLPVCEKCDNNEFWHIYQDHVCCLVAVVVIFTLSSGPYFSEQNFLFCTSCGQWGASGQHSMAKNLLICVLRGDKINRYMVAKLELDFMYFSYTLVIPQEQTQT